MQPHAGMASSEPGDSETGAYMRGQSLRLLLPALLLLGCAGPSVGRTASMSTSTSASVSTTAAALGSTASTSAQGPAAVSGEFSSLIYGLVTDPDQHGLAASYIGGACDGPARLAVTETPSRIEVTVLIGADPKSSQGCPAVGYTRTVAARLAQPIGTRPIFSGEHRQMPFDGSRKLLPSSLPPNFAKTSEQSGSEPAPDPRKSTASIAQASSGVNADDVTTRWTVTYAQPQPASDRCTPTRGLIQIQVGPVDADDFASGWVAAGTVSIAGHQAVLWRAGNANAPTGRAYAWKADRGSVEVIAQVGCQGDRVVDAAELLKVAQSLTTA